MIAEAYRRLLLFGLGYLYAHLLLSQVMPLWNAARAPMRLLIH